LLNISIPTTTGHNADPLGNQLEFAAGHACAINGQNVPLLENNAEAAGSIETANGSKSESESKPVEAAESEIGGEI